MKTELVIKLKSDEPHYPLGAFAWTLRCAADKLMEIQKEHDVRVPYPVSESLVNEVNNLGVLAAGLMVVENFGDNE